MDAVRTQKPSLEGQKGMKAYLFAKCFLLKVVQQSQKPLRVPNQI
jgi:hypothetical protein